MINDDEDKKILLDALNAGTLISAPDAKEQIEYAKEEAAKYLRDRTRINLRLLKSDLQSIQRLAAQKGLPYQTLIASVLHQYATGQLDSK